MGRLGNDITRLRREIADWQEDRETLVESLKENRSRIQRDVGRMQIQFREQRHARATKTRQELGAFRQKITHDVNDLRKTNAQWKTRMPDLKGPWQRMREEIHRNMAEISRQGATDRAAYVSGIRRYLSGLQEGFAAYRKTITEEMDDLRRAWHGAPTVEHASYAVDSHDDLAAQSIQDAAVTAPYDEEGAYDAAPQNSPEEVSFVVSDDLTMITGIAQERQHHLNEVGVTTIEELSHQSAKELQAMLGKPISRDEIQRWIDQAKELTRMM